MKTRAFLALAACVLFPASRLLAQASPLRHATEHVGISWGIHATAAVGYYFTIYDNGATFYTTGTAAGAGFSTWATGSTAMTAMVPGKKYNFVFGSGDWNEAEVHFNAPKGYRVIVNGVPRDNYIARPIRDPATNLITAVEHWALVTLMPMDGSVGLGYGETSPPGVNGDLLWAVGLGTTFAGMPAGTISIRQGDLAGAFSSAALNCDELAAEVAVTRNSSMRIQEVAAPQGTVTVTDYVDGGGNPIGFDLVFGLEVTYQFRKQSTALVITRIAAGASDVTTLTQNGLNWTRTESTDLRTTSYTTSGTSGGIRTEMMTTWPTLAARSSGAKDAPINPLKAGIT